MSWFGKKANAAPPAPLEKKDQAGKELVELMRNIQMSKKTKQDLEKFLNETLPINMDYQDKDGYTALNIATTLSDKSIHELLLDEGASMTKKNYNQAAINAKASAPKKSWFGSKGSAKQNTKLTNKRMVTYKVFNGYKPKAERRFSFKNNRNAVWDLASEDPKPTPGVIDAAFKRYEKLDKASRSAKDDIEYKTLKSLLYNYGKVPSATLNPYEIYTSEGFAAKQAKNLLPQLPPPPPGPPPPSASAASMFGSTNFSSKGNLNNANKGANAAAAAASGVTPPGGAPNNINSTIKRMKCIVCNSQFIIYNGLGKTGTAPVCTKCAAPSAAAPAVGGRRQTRKRRSSKRGTRRR